MTIFSATLLSFLLPFGASDRKTVDINFTFFEPVSPPRALHVMAHHSGMRRAPENTARAIELLIADTVEWVRVDVRRTKDGQHVLWHDDHLGIDTDGKGRLSDRTLAELRAIDACVRFAPRFAGTRILTLIEGLELARGRINICIDCKDVDPAQLARDVIATKMEHQVVICGDPRGRCQGPGPHGEVAPPIRHHSVG